MIISRLQGAIATALLVSSVASAAIIPTTDFAVRRNSGTASVEPSLHAKRTTATATTNRFVMLRFDSSLFGSTATEADFQITGTVGTGWDIAPDGNFQLYGVNDGDAQDEAITNAYNPNATGAIFIGGNHPHVDLTQLTNLGSFLANSGSTSTFDAPSLLNFIQADTNGIVTLVITRNSTGNNSVFADSASLTPPTLTVIPEPSLLALLGLGSLGMLAFAGRFKRQP